MSSSSKIIPANYDRCSRSRTTTNSSDQPHRQGPKLKRLPSIRSTAGVNFSSRQNFRRSKSLEFIPKLDLSNLRNDKVIRSLSPLRYVNSKYNHPSKNSKGSFSPSYKSPPSQPGRFSFGASKSLPPSGGSNSSRRGSSIGDCNNNGSLNHLQRFQHEPLVLPHLFVKSPYDNSIERNGDSASTFIIKSKSTNNIDTKYQNKFNSKSNSKKVGNSRIDLAPHVINTRKCSSNEHIPGTLYSDRSDLPKTLSTGFDKIKVTSCDDTFIRLAPLTSIKNSNKDMQATNQRRPQRGGKENIARSLSYTKNSSTSFRRKTIPNDSSRMKSENIVFPSKLSEKNSKLNNKPPSSEAVPVTIVGRTLTSTVPVTTAWGVSNNSQMQPSCLEQNVASKFARPKLVRNLTYDVIDTKMSNLPVIEGESEAYVSRRRSVDLGRPGYPKR